MEAKRAAAVYAAGHFLVDFSCAFLLLRFVRPTASWQEAALLYNFFAFAGQMPLGLLADRLGHGRSFAAAGCVLAAGAYLLPGAPLALAVTAGLGNALYHIGGGHDTLARSDGRAGLLGLFVSPGALGLFLGFWLGRGAAAPAFLPPLLLLAAAGAVLRLCGKTEAAGFSLAPDRAGTLALLALFLVVCLRSYAGFLFAFPWKSGAWAVVFVLCVAAGKAAGGFLFDRFGGGRTSIASLGLAAGLFLLSDRPLCGCLAVLLFNMTMPVTLRAAADRLPGAKGFSFGLLTFALFLGFLPGFLGLPSLRTGGMYAALCAVSLVLLCPALGREDRP